MASSAVLQWCGVSAPTGFSRPIVISPHVSYALPRGASCVALYSTEENLLAKKGCEVSYGVTNCSLSTPPRHVRSSANLRQCNTTPRELGWYRLRRLISQSAPIPGRNTFQPPFVITQLGLRHGIRSRDRLTCRAEANEAHIARAVTPRNPIGTLLESKRIS